MRVTVVGCIFTEILNRMKKIAFVAIGFLFTCSGFSQLVVDNTVTPEQGVQDVLLGDGVEVFNITFSGDDNQIGSFNSANSNIGLSSGLVLATGDIAVAVGPNNLGGAGLGGGNLGAGDPDLTQLSTFGTNDAAILEFDFLATGDSISFRYVFGSEEYNEYVCGSVNDAFGFFLSGPGINGVYSLNAVNLALVPDTEIPVTINTVNLGVAGSAGFEPQCAQVSPDWANNTEYYIDNENNTSPTSTQLDGLTVVLEAKAGGLQCGETYHIKIAIADAGDTAFDSAVFLEAGSFSSNDVFISADIPNTPPNFPPLTLLEGCIDGNITIVRPSADQNDQIELIVGGTATAELDYELLPTIINFPPGQLSVSIPVVTIYDETVEETETLTVSYAFINSCGDEVDVELVLNILDYNPPVIDIPEEINPCGGESQVVSAEPVDGFAPFVYTWSTGASTPSITVVGGGPSEIFVDLIDYCGFTAEDSFIVVTPDPLFIPDNSDECVNVPIRLLPVGGAQPFTWTYDEENLNFNEETGNWSSDVIGVYLIELVDGCGEGGGFLLEIDVCDTTIPNIFSPNGDGINDTFDIQGWEGFPGSRLEVFNRWGTLVYENDNYQSNWRGDDLAEGTYFYIYYRKSRNSEPDVTFTGTFNIVR